MVLYSMSYSPRVVYNSVMKYLWQESIPVRCEPPTCQPYVLHNEQVWACHMNSEWDPSWTSLNMSRGLAWGISVQWGPMCGRVEAMGPSKVHVEQVWTCPRGSGQCQGVPVQWGQMSRWGRGLCMVRFNASWVMYTWDPRPIPPPWTDRYDWKHYLPSSGVVTKQAEGIIEQTVGQINYIDSRETYLSIPNKWMDLTSALGIQFVIISTIVPWFSKSNFFSISAFSCLSTTHNILPSCERASFFSCL